MGAFLSQMRFGRMLFSIILVMTSCHKLPLLFLVLKSSLNLTTNSIHALIRPFSFLLPHGARLAPKLYKPVLRFSTTKALGCDQMAPRAKGTSNCTTSIPITQEKERITNHPSCGYASFKSTMWED